MIKVYYAHCLAIYNTPQEERDLATLKALGFLVENPNQARIDREVRAIKERVGPQSNEYMLIFKRIIERCDALAFRALPDGRIPSGVGLEITYALEMNKWIFELPSGLLQRTITKELTREYLREVGYR